MKTSFYAYLMHFNGGGAPVLSKKNINLKPGLRFSQSGDTDKIYLAGGFSSFSEQAHFPLSAALQLNGDFGNYSTDDLQQIGLAELNHLNSTTYRSYVQEPDTRVAVLSHTPHTLTQFLETYSGVLQPEPLLVGSFHPDFDTADELEIEALPEGCSIQYMVRKPVDLDKCTYCGDCGPVCSEDCLNEHLFIDMSRCSYCNECVTICPETAIDLYRAEKFTLELPALVLLDHHNVELPNDLTHIYKPDELDRLFSSLIPLNIEETIGWTAAACQFSNRPDSGCTACLDACKHNALEQNQDTIVINFKNCVECGACLASCPTGALQYHRFTDQQFIDWLNTARPKKNSSIILGSNQELHRLWWKRNAGDSTPLLFLEHPNPRALTAMHLLFLLSLGAKKIILLDETALCQDKPIASQIEIANAIFCSLFGGGERTTIATLDTLSATLQESEPTPLQNLYHEFSFTSRRKKTSSILSFFLEHSLNEEVMLSGEPFQTFGTIDCETELCTHCGACLNECRIEALTTDSKKLSLDHSGIQCVQCGTCVDVCPEKALKLNPGLLLAPEFITPQELTRAEPVECLECGKPFGTRKSYERIVAILKEKNPDNLTDHVLEYCETCRVVKMFEVHQQ